jgi:branched-chain amino acid transport system substrate-binding protein
MTRVLASCALAFAICIAALVGTASAQLNGTVKIAVVQDLTGPTSVIGVPERNAAVLAAEQLNASGLLGNAKIELIVEDSRGTKEGAVNAFQKVISRDRVVAIFGPTLTVQGFPAHPIAQKAGVPAISASNVGKNITAIGDYIFVTSTPEYKLMIPNLVETVYPKLKPARVAAIEAKDQDFAIDAVAAYARAFKSKGIELLATETFITGETNFFAQLSKLKELKPDALIVAALFQESGLIMSQARDIGIPASVVFLGTVGMNNPKTVELAGKAADGALFGTTWYPSSRGTVSQKFAADFRAKFNSEPDHFSAQAYDAVLLLGHAIGKAKTTTNRKAIRDALAKLEGVPGVLGESLRFDGDRHLVAKPFVLTFKDGKVVPYQ